MKRFKIGLSILAIIGFIAISVNADYVTAYRKDAFYQGSILDHTYACISSTGCYAIVGLNGYPSTNYGGVPAMTTIYFSHQNAIFATCVANNYMQYGTNGACHQHTNRILYYAGASLPYGLRGYSASKILYGIYGECGPVAGRFSTAIATCGNRQ